MSMLILIDRAIDPATPMCTQLTYEGLVDEMLAINNGVVQIEGPGDTVITCRLTLSFLTLLTCRETWMHAAA